MIKVLKLGLAIVVSVMLLSIFWEFILEDRILPLFGHLEHESHDDHWEFVFTSTAFAFVALIFPLYKVKMSDNRRRAAELERENVIDGLQQALAEIKTLQGMIPICSHCKKVRDDTGFWQQVESYVTEHSHAEFSHSICPDCARESYGEYLDDEDLG